MSLRPFAALLAPLLLACTPPAHASTNVDVGALLQLVDYIAVDYPAAVQHGAVVSEAEYAEMLEFSGRAAELAASLQGAPQDAAIAAAARELAALVAARADVEALRRTANALRRDLLAAHPQRGAPRSAPDLAGAQRNYVVHCAGCHGVTGRGDGPQGAALEPAPTDFTDRERAQQRSLVGLHSTIARGVDGTAMRAFPELSEAERWDLAWHVGALHASGASSGSAPPTDLTLERFTERTPAELLAEGVPADLVEALRADPAPLFAASASPLAIARARLADAARASAAGDSAAAYTAALAAYLDGFELAEPSLRAIAPDRVVEVEREMLGLREALRAAGAGDGLASRFAALDAELAELAVLLAGRSTLDAPTAFTASLFILLREGLEAILLVGLMVTVLIKTGRRDALRPVHQGWIAALLLGAATWAASSWIIEISGATREMTEGIAALLAAVVLFYVGFWMHDKLSAARWQSFLKEQLEGALAQGSRWTLALLSFVAVYREVFETVLFYQALWVQADADAARTAILAGALAAAVALALLWLAVFRLGMRLPLHQFFGISATLMIALAIVFAGKGVAALQEAGRVPFDALPLPSVELLGIYPTAQSLGLQLALLGLAVALVLYNRRAEARAG